MDEETIPPAAFDVKEQDGEEERAVVLLQWLRCYFYPVFKARQGGCDVNLIRCVFMLIEIIKLFLVTVMMVELGMYREEFKGVVDVGDASLRHVLLKTWTFSQEKQPYPPSGTYAIYDRAELREHVQYAIERIYHYPTAGVGIYQVPRGETDQPLPMKMCIKYYHLSIRESQVREAGARDTIDMRDFCFLTSPNVYRVNGTGKTEYKYHFLEEITENNATMAYKYMLDLTLQFRLNSIRISKISQKARCLDIRGTIYFNDTDTNGQVVAGLTTDTSQVPCSSIGANLTDAAFTQLQSGVTATVVLFTVLSIVKTLVSMVTGGVLCWKTRLYFKCNPPGVPGGRDRMWKEYVKFVNLWDISVLAGDILILYGSTVIAFANTVHRSESPTVWTLAFLDTHVVWLGSGCTVMWATLLRYFKFHSKFNLLFATFYNAVFDVLAFLACVVVLFCGFVVVGYIVIGPYHVKFKTLIDTAESLFTMMINNEVYLALVNLTVGHSTESDVLIWWFARIFVYVYVFLFTILVKSLLTALFISAYRVIQERHKEYQLNKNWIHKNPTAHALMEVLDGPDYSDVSSCLRRLLQGSGRMTVQEHALRQELLSVIEYRQKCDCGEDRRGVLKQFIERPRDKEDDTYYYTCCNLSGNRDPLFRVGKQGCYKS